MSQPEIRPAERRIVTAAILCGIFLVAMDILVVSVAMPAIVGELGDITYYAWVSSIYVLASTTTVPLYGKLSDMHGRKPIYLIGLGLFLLGSVGSGLSVSMGMLVVARAVQGLGGGGLMPVTLTIVGDLYPLKERARMQGLFSSVWGLASILGPLIGGTLVDNVGWRWIFFINLPIGVLAGVLIHRFLREEDFRRSPHAVPYAAAGLLGASILLFLLGLFLPGMGASWASPKVLGAFALALLLLALFLGVDRRAKEPVIDRPLFRMRMFVSSNLAGFFVSASLYGAAYYVPLYVQHVQQSVQEVSRMKAMVGGFALTPMSLGWVLAAIIAGRMVLRVGYRAMGVSGLSLVALGSYLLSTLEVETSYASLLVYMATTGVGLGLSMTSFIIAVQNSVPRERLGGATSSLQLFRMTGSVVGLAALGAVMLTTLPPDLRGAGGILRQDPTGEKVVTDLDVAERVALARSLRFAFLGAFCFSMAGLVSGLFIPGGKAEAHLHVDRRKEIAEGPPAAGDDEG